MASPNPPEPQQRRQSYACRSQCRGPHQRLQLGAALCAGPGPRPPPALGARGSRHSLCRAQARRDGGTPADYFEEQPFGQVPSYRDDTVSLFESGAIVLHIGRDCEALLPADPAARARATAWLIAALNSVEPYRDAARDDRHLCRRRGMGEIAPPRRGRDDRQAAVAPVRRARRQALSRRRSLHRRRSDDDTVLRILDGKGLARPVIPISSPTRRAARRVRHSRRRSPRRSPISSSARRYPPEATQTGGERR